MYNAAQVSHSFFYFNFMSMLELNLFLLLILLKKLIFIVNCNVCCLSFI